MKKLRILLTLLVCLLVTVTLTSCKNKLNYEICGYYIEIIEMDKWSMNDKNPKIYFKKHDDNILSSNTGNVGKVLYFTDITKVRDEQNGKFTFSAILSTPADTFDNIKIHVIIYQNGEYLIDKDVYKTIKTEGVCQYSSKYKYKDKEYHVQFDLKIETR